MGAKRRFARWAVGRLDAGIIVLLFLIAFAVYVKTLLPSVQLGDVAEFQYLPHILGIAHPTGYPLYVLLGKLWSLIPLGSIAYRMNLLSAFSAAWGVGVLYLVARHVAKSRWAAMAGALTFGFTPTFWSRVVVAEVYALNVLLAGLCWYLLLRWRQEKNEAWLMAFAFFYGLSLCHHRTMILLAPAFVLLIGLEMRRFFTHTQRLAVLGALFILPLALYAYIPLRGAQLLRSDQPIAGLDLRAVVGHGLVHAQYKSSLEGFMDLVLRGGYTNRIVPTWIRRLARIGVFLRMLIAEFGYIGLSLGVLGAIRQALVGRRLLSVFLLAHLVIVCTVMGLEVGDNPAFLLLSSFLLTIWITIGLHELWCLGIEIFEKIHWAPGWMCIAILALSLGLLPLSMAKESFQKANRSNDRAVHDYWVEVLEDHPIEEGAGVVAHWGDLTPLWYMQHAEGNRPDLVGIFPPDEGFIKSWVEAGHPLYIAAPFHGWSPGIEDRYQLTSWGKLVRISPLSGTVELPTAEVLTKVNLSDRILLLGYDMDQRAPSGAEIAIRLHWRALGRLEVDDDYLVIFSLLDQAGNVANRMSDSLISGWYPGDVVAEGEKVLGIYRFPMPLGTPPGIYHIQLEVYSYTRQEKLVDAERQGVIALGSVIVNPALRRLLPSDLATFRVPWRLYFGDDIQLLGYRLGADQVRAGDSLSVDLLWRAVHPAQGDYYVGIELLDQGHKTRAQTDTLLLGGAYPPSHWTTGKVVRDRQSLLVPAAMPAGKYTVMLSGYQVEGKRPLAVRRWFFPTGNALALGSIEITSREHSFQVPFIDSTLEAFLGGRVKLLGYALSQRMLEQGETLSVTLYWQALREMRISYTVFTHLIDETGQIWGQKDSIPGNYTLPTTSWLKGEIVVDEYTLTVHPNTPRGDYSLEIGMYDACTGERLPVSSEGQMGDRVLIRGLRVE